MEASVDFATDVLQVTQRFYAVAMSDGGWEVALDPLVDLLHARHAVIFASAPYGKTSAVAASAGMDKSDFTRFLSPEAARWLAPLKSVMPVGTAAIHSDLISDRHLENTEFYNEIMRPAGGFHGVVAQQNQPALSYFIAVCRSRQAGDFAPADRAFLQALLPHLTLAIEFHCKLRVAEQGRQQFGHILNRLDAGIILTDGRARPVFANSYAQRLTAAEDGLKLDHLGLTTSNFQATQRLRTAVAAMCVGAVHESRHVYLERSIDKPPLHLTVMPIWQFEAIAGTGGPSVAIIVREPPTPLTAAALDTAQAFHLTDREKEVAALVAGGFKRAQIAGKLGISEATVKTHLQHLFEKTGTRRQIDLIKRLVEYTSAFA
jgi:DNA-binding CsgD family transcriptional regulator/PAS domain-containing protein